MRRYQILCDCGLDKTYTRAGNAEKALDQHDCRGHRTTHRRSCPVCGWSGTYSTAARADYAERRHSCTRQLALAASHARAETRAALIDRTPKPCLHKQAVHRHGTYACYTLDRCKCLPCAKANSDYEAARTRQQAYGRWNGLTDAAAAREHVQQLLDKGMGLKRVIAVSGVSSGTMWKLVYGRARSDGTKSRSERIRPDVERRILATTLDLADGARIDSVGAARRVQALVALGWSMTRIATFLGIQLSNFTAVAHGRGRITVSRDRAIRSLYDEISMTLPPQDAWHDKISASRARNYAKARGWLPPLAWDDEALDDPNATAADASRLHADHRPAVNRGRAAGAAAGTVPAGLEYLDEAAIDRRIHGDRAVHLTFGEAGEAVARMRAAGVSLCEVERRTGINPHRHVHREAS